MAKKKEPTVEEISDDDLSNLQKFHPMIKRLDQDPILTKDKRGAIIRKYTDDYSGFHISAYINHPKHVSIITMSADNIDSFEDTVDEFKGVVASYEFKTKDVNQMVIRELAKEQYPDIHITKDPGTIYQLPGNE